MARPQRGFPVEALEHRFLFAAAQPLQCNIALIDSTLPDAQLLIDAALGSTRVITYDGATESARAVLGRVVASAASGGRPIASLSIFSHGLAGRFRLGNDWISAGDLAGTAGQWRDLRGAFAPGASVQIYGCDTADGVSGQRLLGELARCTGATVFGSTDITGHDGDWTLEAAARHATASGTSAPLVDPSPPMDPTALAAYPDDLIWTGATTGGTNDASHDYNNPANWAGGVIDDSLAGVTLTGGLTLYVSADHTTGGAGLNLGYSGNFDLTIESSSAAAQTLTLAGNVTGDFGGANGRTVTLGNGANPLNLDLNGAMTTFTVADAGDTLDVVGAVADGSLTKDGPGAMILAGGNTFAGGTTLSAGTLDVNGATALGTGTLTANGGTIDNTSGAAVTLATNNAQTWAGSFAFAGTNDLSLGTGPVTLTSATTVTTTAGTLTVGGNIGDGGNGYAVTKAGAGTLALGGASTYSGGTVVNAGTLQVYDAAGTTGNFTSTALGSAAATVNAGATLWLDYQEVDPAYVYIYYDNAFAGAGTLRVTAPDSADASGWSTSILTGNLSGMTGTIDLFPSSGNLGKTCIADTATGSQPSASATIKIENNTALFIQTGLTYASSIQVSGAGDASGLGALRLENGTTVSGSVTLMSNATVGGNLGTGLISGSIGDGGHGYTLTKVGANTIALGGSSTYSGGTVVNAGTLQAYDAAGGTAAITPAPLGSTASTATVNAGATLWLDYQISNPGDYVYYANAFAGAGTLRVTAPDSAPITTAAVLSGNLSGLTGTIDLFPNSGNVGKTAFTSSTPGFQPSPSATIKIESGTTLAVLNGLTYASSIQDFSAGNSEGLGSLRAEYGTTFSGNLALMANSSFSTSYGVGTVSGAISDGGNGYSLTKLGGSQMTLSGANTYSGGTIITAGTVLVDNATGSGTGTGPVTVSSGATFGGTGTVSGAVTAASGGTFAPGDAGPGAFATGNLTLQAGSTFAADINSATAGAGYDQANVNGTVNLTGSTLSLSGTRASHAWDTITLINNDGVDAVTGTFNGLPEGAVVTSNGVPYTISYQGGTGNDVVLTDASPTIATAAAAAPSAVTGTTSALSVLGTSSAGESTLTYTWAATTKPTGASPTFSPNGTNGAKNSTVTFNKAGSYTFTATVADGYGDTATSAVSVTVAQTFTTAAASPATASVRETATQQFTATGYDQFGASMVSQPAFAWTQTSGVGTVSGAGLYTAPGLAGTATVTATSGSVTASATVTVTNAAPTVATAAAASPTTVAGATTALSVLGSDDNGEPNLTYTWAATTKPAGSNPTFSANGTNGAKASTVTFDRAGSYRFTVTISDGQGGTVTGAVNVTVATLAFTVTNTNDAGAGSLRAALASADAAAGPSTVLFDLPTTDANYDAGTGTWTIVPITAMPTLTATVTVDGTSQPGYTGSPLVVLHGTSAYPRIDGLTLGAGSGGSTIEGLTLSGFIDAIVVDSPGNTIRGNWIGLTADGMAADFDTYGISVDNAGLTLIGGTAAGAGNVISGNLAGVHLDGAATTGTRIEGNDIGTDPTGSVAIGNSSDGVEVTAGTGGNTIGGTAPGSGNVISGNGNYGVALAGSGNTVAGNTIGLNAAGNAALPNEDGLYLSDAAGNAIGGTTAAARNVISGNSNDGVYITGASTTGNLIEGNYIGTDATGTVALGNGSAGVEVEVGATGNTIGGPAVGAGNVLSGNTYGVNLAGDANVVAGNVIGLDATGTVSLGGVAGVLLAGAGNTIGGTAAADANVIAGSTYVGVYVYGSTATGDAIEGNSIYGNGGLGIDLVGAGDPPSGITPNTGALTPGEPNLLMNTPVFNWAYLTGTSLVVSGYVGSAAGQSAFAGSRVEVFASDDSAANGSGQTLLGVLTTDANGDFAGTLTGVTAVAVGTTSITGTATDGAGDTSEFGPNYGVTSPTALATAASASPAAVVGTTTDLLSALGDNGGYGASLTYTWATTGTPPATVAFSANGTNAAQSTTATFAAAGTYHFQVTIADTDGLFATSSVTVTVSQTLTTVTVAPGATSLNETVAQQFAATGFDQFAAPMASQPTFSWTKTTGVGSISGTGLYTAPASAGTATVTATSGSVTGSAAVTVTNATPTVATAAAASPTTVTGSTTALSVLGADDNGEPNLTYTWAATTKPAGSNPTFSANGTNGAKASTVTFNLVGNYVFTVTISDGQGGAVTSAASVTVSQTLTTIAVSPPTASLNEDATQQFAAVAYDQFGVTMASPPTFAWAKGSGIGSVGGGGVYTAPGSSGSATVTASSGSVTGTAAVTVANGAPTVATAAAASPTSVTGTTTALSVLGADDNGEPNLTYTWAATTKPAGSSPAFSVNGTNGAKASTVTFDRAGSYTFTVTVSDGQGGNVTSAVSVTVAQTLTAIAVTPTTAAINEDATQQFSAVAYDQFAVAMASQPSFTWTKGSGIGSVSGTGLYTAPGSSGTASVSAASGAVAGFAAVTVNNASPAVAAAAAASPTTVTGNTSSLSVLGADDNGEPNLTYTWSATNKPAGSNPTFSANVTNAAQASTVTFDRAGSYTFTATIDDGQGGTVSSAVSVTVAQTLTTIAVSPAAASLNEDATRQFAATGYDQFGTAMDSQPAFTWAKGSGIGSVSAAGLYTAPAAAGSATVTATSGAVSGSAAVTVTNGAPTVATAAAASPASVTGTTSSLSVLGADDNGEPNLTYTWAATVSPPGASPSFSANGTNAARASTVTFDRAGSYTFTVTIDDGQGGTVSSAVSVTVAQTLTTIAVTPSTASVNEDQAQQFAATGYDQFGVAMASQPAVTWSKGSGVGSVGATGVYTAPGAAGSATVTATSGSVTGSAAVSVTNAAPTVAAAAAATPTSVTGTTAALSVLGADDNGEANLTYTWAATARVAGSNPTFSANGTNGAQSSTVTFDRAGSYTFTVTISDGQSGSATSAVNVVVAQTLASIAVAPAAASLNEDAAQPLAATAYDQFGVAMASQPTFAWAVAAGVGSVDGSGLYTAPGTAGTATVTATSGPVTGSAAVTVTNGAPTVAAVAAASPTTVTSVTTALSVLGADDNGEPNLTYTWAATTKPAGSNPTFSANGTNAAKASTVTFDRAGSYTCTVTLSDGQGGTVTSPVSVTVAQTLTTITVSPASASLNEDAAQPFAATGHDQFGVAMASQPPFAWAVAAGVGSVDGAGLYTAPGATGTATVRATAGSVTGSASVTVTNGAPTVATAAAASPTSVTGATTALSALGTDDDGEPNLTYTWAATTRPAGASPTFSANGTNGAKASNVTFDLAGNYTFTVTIDDGQGGTVTSAVSVAVAQTLTTITVTPGTASLNEDGGQQFAATGYDQFGTSMASQPAFAWARGSGVGSVSGSGLYTAPGSSGTASVTATSGAVSGSAMVTVTDAAPTVATAAAASPTTVTGTTTALSVLGADDNGEPNLTYAWAATAKPVGASPAFSANGTNGARASTVTFDQAGNYMFTVTIDDGQGGRVTSAVSVAVAQTLNSITVTPSTVSANEGQAQQFAAVGYDQFGLAMASQPTVTWAKGSGVGSVGATGVFTAPGAAGSATLTATSGSVTGSATVTVTNAAPTVATAAAASPMSVTGTTTALSVLGADDNGEPNLTYAWAATARPVGASPAFGAGGTNAARATTVTFDAAGSYTFTVTISDGQGGTITSAVSVTVAQTLAGITVTPAAASLNENGTQPFAATGHDQFGAAMSTQPTFAWAVAAGVGSVDGSGLYTAPANAGTATVTATSGSVTGSAAATVTNAAPTVATAAAATPSPVTGTTTALSVLGADDGGAPNLTYTWAATTAPAGASPTFSANGTNGAKASTVTFDRSGAYTFTATIDDGQGGTITSAVSVTVDQAMTAITVTPATATVHENQTQQLAATGYDQFGQPMAVQPALAWAVVAGAGSVDGSGLYTAPSAVGAATVTATSGSVAASAAITVSNTAPTVATAAAASTTVVTGTTVALSVLGADDNGEAALTYTWAATAKPAGSQPAFSANGTNAAKSSTVTFDRAGLYRFTVTISDGQGGSATSGVNVTVDQSVAAIAVTPAAAVLNEDQTRQFTATAHDQFGGAVATQPPFAWAVATGAGSVDASGLYTAPAAAGTATVTATSGPATGTAAVTVTNAPPTVATAAAATPSPVTGTTAALSALGADDNGEPNLTYTWAATTRPPGPGPAFSANGTNAAKSSTVTFHSAGSYTFTVTIDDGQGATTTSAVAVTVAQTLASIAVTPGAASLNEDVTQQFTAVGFDQFGTPMASQPPFAWSKATGTGTVGGTGLYTAPAAAAAATVAATSGAVTGTATVAVTNATPSVATAAAASPTTVTGATAALSVLGSDDNGEPNLTYTWAATTEPVGSSPTFSANGTNGAKDSTVTFGAAGSYTFTVTISDGQGGTVTSDVGVVVDQTLTSIAVTPATVALNENGTQQLAATGYDQFGAAMASRPTVAWSVSNGVGAVDGTGLFTAPAGTGTATVAATSGGVTGQATVAVTNAVPTVAAAATATPSPVTGTTAALSVLGADDGGEPNLTYAWAATTLPTGASPTFSANGTDAAKGATVTFDRAGSYTFTVTISDGTNATASAVSVTVDQTLTTVAVTPGATGVNLNGSRSFAAVGYDQFGQAMVARPTFAWDLASGVGGVDPTTGVYTAGGSAGAAVVRATAGSVAGTATVTVTDAAPTVAAPAAAAPPSVAGTTADLSVLGADDGGEPNLTYAWSMTAGPTGAAPTFSANGTNGAKASTVTFNAAGGYTFAVTISDGTHAVASSVNVTVAQTLATAVVGPSTAALHLNGSQAFTVVGYDQFGAAMAQPPTFAWSVAGGVGGIGAATGVYTAGATAGTAVIRATSGGVTGGTAAATVTDAAPTVAVAAAVNPGTVTGTSTALSVLGADDGGEPNLTYTWTATAAPAGASPAFSANDTNGAKATTVTFDRAGTYTFTVAIADPGGNVATSGVAVTVAQTVTTVTVTPAAVTLAEEGTRQLSAVGYDQFGDAMASQPAFAWADPSGVGSIDGNGLYTAPAAGGSATITAVDGPVTGSATVTVPAIGAPAGLVADVGVGQVQLTWQRPAGAYDGVIIERSTDGLSWAQIGTVDGSTTTFIDRTATVATTYLYRAVALQVGGGDRQESAASNVVTATPGRSPAIAPVPPVPVVPPGPMPVVPPGPMVVVPQPVTVTVPDLPAVPPAGDGPAQGQPVEPAAGPPAESPVSAAPVPDAAGVPDAHPHVAPTPAPKPQEPKPPQPTNRGGDPPTSAGPPVAGPATPSAGVSAPRSRITVCAAFRAIGLEGAGASAVATEARAAEVHRRRVGAVVAAAITAVATGSLLWMVQSGALLATALSALPFWRWVDPLPVLEAWERDAQRRYDQRRRTRRRPADPSDDEERELGKVID